jgi:recombination protein RecT
MASTATALVRVEESPAVLALDARSQALLELLPDEAAATRFRRVVIQALTKNPELLECTPESIVTSVFEAAAQGLEPTGATGGAHLVPFNVNVGTRDNPRWEKRAQLIPDYRGVVQMVTRPDPVTKRPSEVVSIEARVVKEGDEFAYELGTEAWVRHVPTLAPDRSQKPTTHVYAVAHLRSGPPKPDVEDRAGIERIRQRATKKGRPSPWDSDWDEMAKKTIVKRLAKLLPVRPEVRSILAREDEEPDDDEAPATVSTRGPATARLAARIRGSSSTTTAAAATSDAGATGAAAAPETTSSEAHSASEPDDAAFIEVDAPAAPEIGPMTLAELSAWLKANRIAGDYAGQVAKQLWPDRATAADLTDEERGALARKLAGPDGAA